MKNAGWFFVGWCGHALLVFAARQDWAFTALAVVGVVAGILLTIFPEVAA